MLTAEKYGAQLIAAVNYTMKRILGTTGHATIKYPSCLLIMPETLSRMR